MSLVEFLAAWAGVIGLEAAVVGWAFAVRAFGLSNLLTVMLGVSVPIALAMFAMWMVVRR